MRLPDTEEFLPGYYLATFLNGQAALLEDPEYDGPHNVMVAKKVATDGLDVDGGKIYIDFDDVRVFEPITLEKLQDVRTASQDRNLVQRIKSKMELKHVLDAGRDAQVISGGSAPCEDSGEDDINPPSTSGPTHKVPAPSR